MAGLFRNDPETREGKYPVLLRRDGTVPEWEWFVLGARDPAAPAGIRAYADEAEHLGFDPAYVNGLRKMATSWEAGQKAEADERVDRARATRYMDDPLNWSLTELPKPADPDGPRHRTDDPRVLQFPGSLRAFSHKVGAELLRSVSDRVRELASNLYSDDAGGASSVDHLAESLLQEAEEMEKQVERDRQWADKSA